MKTNHSLSIGTAAGTLLSILPTLSSSDLLRTAVLAAVGATASFVVSFLLKLLVAKLNFKIKE